MPNELSEKSKAQPASDSKGPATTARLALIQSLEELRERVHRQLDALETIARARAEQSAKALHEREEQLQQRVVELEHAHLHIKNEADRWERERKAMLEQIEHDRRLLAEAWERLEREQVKNFGVVQTAARSTVASAPAPIPVPWPVTLSPSTGRDQPVAEEVLRQFQSLRRDVRRNAATSLAL
jgi:hypothetical protein